jgi:uncharacterized metal-binding protein YceD (DUF177 family)
VKSKKEYIIPFIGLKLGFHEFEFDIRDTFFEDRDYSLIHSGNVNVKLVLEKKETMLIGEFTINGSVFTDCDRCNDQVEVPVKGQYRVIFKFGLEPSDDETLIVLHPDAYEIDLYDQLYEFITVSLPTRSVHPKGECNEEMLELLNKYSLQKDEDDEDWDDEDWDEEDDDEDDWDDDDEDDDDDDPIDPRWSGLKNLN